MASHNNFKYFQNKLTELECMSVMLIKDEKSYVTYVDKFVKKAKLIYKSMNVYICQIEHIPYLSKEFVYDFTYLVNWFTKSCDRQNINFKAIKNMKDNEIGRFLNYIFAVLYDTLDDLEESAKKRGLI